MEILIVDAFSESEEGRNNFKLFRDYVVKLSKKYAFGGELTTYVRKYNDLDDFIYENDSKYTNESSIHRFDTLDIIFIDGGAAMLPWLNSFDKIRILIKMCIYTEKCLFCCSTAAMILCYICHIGSRKYKILNGAGKGSSIKDLENYESLKLPPTEVFYDNQNGHFYNYHAEYKSWKSLGSCGLIYKHAKQQSSRLYTPTYPIHSAMSHPVYSTPWECPCYILSEQTNNWLIKEIKLREFVVPIHSQWIMINNSPIFPFTVICENERNPILFEYRNSVGAFFHINSRYPQTVVILETFIRHKVELMRENGTIHRSAVILMRIVNKKRPFSARKAPSNVSLTRSNSNNQRPSSALPQPGKNNHHSLSMPFKPSTLGNSTQLLHINSIYDDNKDKEPKRSIRRDCKSRCEKRIEKKSKSPNKKSYANLNNVNEYSSDCDFYYKPGEEPPPPPPPPPEVPPVYRFTIKSTPYSRYNYYRDMNIRERKNNNNNRFIGIRNDGRMYKDRQHMEFEEREKNREAWVNEEDFENVIGKATTTLKIEVPVISCSGPYRPPALYDFRTGKTQRVFNI